MAVFRVPRITTLQRTDLLLQIGEIVYDIDQNVFYGGDGITNGGFLIGEGLGTTVSKITITLNDIVNKYIILPSTPFFPDSVIVTPVGGIEQVNGEDFEVVGNQIRWDGKGFDGFLEENDVLIVQH